MAFQILPWAIAALAAGTVSNIAAQRKQNKAMSRAYSQYAKRSDQRTAEASALFERALKDQDVTTQQGVVDAAAAEKVARVDDLVADGEGYVDPILPGQDRAPAVIRSQASAKLADELARARAEIAALAKLEGYSSRTFDRGLQLNRVKPELANIGIFAEGDRNMLDADMFAAQQKGAGLRTLGDLLTAVGQMGLMAYGGGIKTIGGKALGAGGVPMAQSGVSLDGILNSPIRMG